ncbi:30S ribosomal protein S21 [Candidatus Vidania fulgoroideorum]
MIFIKKNNENIEQFFRRYKKKIRDSKIIEKLKEKRFYKKKL